MISDGTLKDKIELAYRGKTGKSAGLNARASSTLPMGVSGAAKFYEPYPVYLARADGGRVWDVDGNEYVDYLMGAGPGILGHRHPLVHRAVTQQLDEITQVLAPTQLEIEFAERLQHHMPYLERIRFTNTGSEAGPSGECPGCAQAGPHGPASPSSRVGFTVRTTPS